MIHYILLLHKPNLISNFLHFHSHYLADYSYAFSRIVLSQQKEIKFSLTHDFISYKH